MRFVALRPAVAIAAAVFVAAEGPVHRVAWSGRRGHRLDTNQAAAVVAPDGATQQVLLIREPALGAAPAHGPLPLSPALASLPGSNFVSGKSLSDSMVRREHAILAEAQRRGAVAAVHEVDMDTDEEITKLLEEDGRLFGSKIFMDFWRRVMCAFIAFAFVGIAFAVVILFLLPKEELVKSVQLVPMPMRFALLGLLVVILFACIVLVHLLVIGNVKTVASLDGKLINNFLIDITNGLVMNATDLAKQPKRSGSMNLSVTNLEDVEIQVEHFFATVSMVSRTPIAAVSLQKPLLLPPNGHSLVHLAVTIQDELAVSSAFQQIKADKSQGGFLNVGLSMEAEGTFANMPFRSSGMCIVPYELVDLPPSSVWPQGLKDSGKAKRSLIGGLKDIAYYNQPILDHESVKWKGPRLGTKFWSFVTLAITIPIVSMILVAACFVTFAACTTEDKPKEADSVSDPRPTATAATAAAKQAQPAPAAAPAERTMPATPAAPAAKEKPATPAAPAAKANLAKAVAPAAPAAPPAPAAQRPQAVAADDDLEF